MDWAPGDLALLFIAGERDCPLDVSVIHGGEWCPPRGCVRQVSKAIPTENDFGYRCGCTDLFFTDGTAAASWRCKKITPDEADAFDREVIAALNSEPVHARNNDAVHNSCQREGFACPDLGQVGSAG